MWKIIITTTNLTLKKKKSRSWRDDLQDIKYGMFASLICWLIYNKYFEKEEEEETQIPLLRNEKLFSNFIVNDNLLQRELEFILLNLVNHKFSKELLNEVVLQNILQCFCKIDNEQISILSTKIIQKLLSENFNERTINYLYEFTTRNDQFLNLLLLQKNLQNNKNYLYNQFFLYLDGKKSSSTTTNLEMLQYRMFDLYTFYFSNPIIIKNILNDYKNNNYKFNYINYLFEKVNDFKTDKYDRLFYLTCLQQLYLSLQQLDKNDTTIINEFNNQYEKITKNGKELQWLQFMKSYPLPQSTVENQNNNNNNKLLPHLFYFAFFALYFSTLYKKRNVKSAVLKTSLISYYYAYRLNGDQFWEKKLKSIDKESTTLTNKEFIKKWELTNNKRLRVDIVHDIMTIVTGGFIPFLLIHFTVGKIKLFS
ncbi:hypothetical protein ABK040_000461 [Willaertia magna]